MEADCQNKQYDVALNIVWHNRMDVGSSQFSWTCFVTTHSSNPGYIHPLCLCGDKGSKLG
jgi:hypothetical protein